MPLILRGVDFSADTDGDAAHHIRLMIRCMSVENETPAQRAERLQQERDRAIAWISEKWKQRYCPICGESSWTVDNVVEVRQFEMGNIVIGGDSTIFPLVPIVCDNCGYTFFINALRSKTIARPAGSENA